MTTHALAVAEIKRRRVKVEALEAAQSAGRTQ